MRLSHTIAACVLLLAAACNSDHPPTPPTPDADVRALVARIEDPSLTGRLSIASFEHTARDIVAANPDVKALIAKGAPAAAYLASRFADPSLKNRDHALAHYAYVIESVKYRDALPALSRFLGEAKNRGSLFWAIKFAEHARSSLEAVPPP
jgi:hypothetical protein